MTREPNTRPLDPRDYGCESFTEAQWRRFRELTTEAIDALKEPLRKLSAENSARIFGLSNDELDAELLSTLSRHEKMYALHCSQGDRMARERAYAAAQEALARACAKGEA